MNKNLTKELLELSKRVEDFNISSFSQINHAIELSDDIQLPFVFSCEALHPGVFKGFTIEEDEIIKATNTIFQSEGNFHNYDINKDHNSSRKSGSSVDDVIGKVINASYDMTRKAYMITGEIYDKSIALKMVNGLLKYVSLRIKPERIVEMQGQKFARELSFQEMSLVRAPGDPNARITAFNR